MLGGSADSRVMQGGGSDGGGGDGGGGAGGGGDGGDGGDGGGDGVFAQHPVQSQPILSVISEHAKPSVTPQK